MKIKLFRVLLVLLGFLFVESSIIYAQSGQREVTGIVVDEQGIAIPGVTLAISSTKGTISDMDGRFSMKLTKDEKIIMVSSIGFEKKTVDVSSGDFFTIILVDQFKELNEVVIVGYGAVKKSDLSGSVSVLDMKNSAEEQPSANLAQYMQGRVAGVQISQNSGAPGSELSIKIRGTSTITGETEPLYVVDGVPMDDISMVNSNDVESMHVLKDASATAIYGSRGTNGVVIITTKKGVEGKLQVSYNYRMDISQITKKYDLINAYELGLYENELDRTHFGFDQNGNVQREGEWSLRNDADKLAQYQSYSTDWQDLMYETGISQSHQILLSGGDERSIFSLSGFYDDQGGVIMNTGQKKYGFRMNHTYHITDKLKFTSRVNYTDANLSQVSHSDNNSSSTIIHQILMTKPYLIPDASVVEEDFAVDEVPRDNPYKLVKEKYDDQRKQLFMGNFVLDYEIVKGLNATVRGSLSSNTFSRKRYAPTGTFEGDRTNGALQRWENKVRNSVFESTLKYNKKIGKHHKLNGVVGWTYEEKVNDNMNLKVSNFPSNDLGYDGLSSGIDASTWGGNFLTKKLSSFIGRANYTLKEKYIFTATGRYDGSSLLAEGNQWAFFPSGAVAWRVSEEPFLKKQRIITNLKLKASYGVTGNQNIGYAAPISVMNFTSYPIGGDLNHAVVPGSMANPDLTWEVTTQQNIGVELGFIKNRYRLNIDAFRKVTKDLLVDLKMPPSGSYASVPYNTGEIENKGIEIDVAADIFKGKFRWTLGGNIAVIRNEVLSLDGNSIDGPNFLAGGGILNQPIHRTMEGYPVGTFYGYVVDGLYQTPEEAKNAPIDAVAPATPGSIRYKDISGPEGVPDGRITADDMTVLGHSQPDFTYGITNDFAWKGFNLSILVQGSQGGKVANLNNFKLNSFTNNHSISREAWEGRWTGPGTSNKYPVVDGSKSSAYFGTRFTNFVLEDASFVRLKNVTLSYRFAPKQLKVIKSLKVFATASNLFTLTDYSGYDPENTIPGSPMKGGVDFAIYPMTSTYSFGVNVGF